jgi:hypothetical protein
VVSFDDEVDVPLKDGLSVAKRDNAKICEAIFRGVLIIEFSNGVLNRTSTLPSQPKLLRQMPKHLFKSPES